MTPKDITRLGQISDELYALAAKASDPEDSRSTSPEQTIRRCSHALQDAITELMQKAAMQYRHAEVRDIRVIREKQPERLAA